MTDQLSYPADAETFERLLGAVERVVDTGRRLPARPFWTDASSADVCQYSHVVEGPFGEVLQALVDDNGDEAITLVVLDPSPRYYRDNYGSYPAFTLPGAGLSEAYWEAVAYEPGGDPTGAVIYTANVVALTGSSGRWAVWGERAWDVAVLMTERPDGPWLSRGVPFVSAEVALADFTEPDFKMALDEDDRTTFLRNFGHGSANP